MFTLAQVRAAHANVKSGTDFPQYAQILKQLGVIFYDLFVADGHAQYVGEGDFTLTSAPASAPLLRIAETGSPALLKQALAIHQQGQTDYRTFCQQAAAAGVEKWTVHTGLMTCTYYDRQGQPLVVEEIPAG